MISSNLSSKLLEKAVNEFSKLPGVGKKTALRHVLYLLKQDQESVDHFGNSIIELRKNIRYCTICHNLSDSETCLICSERKRNKNLICVVESIKDVIAIENTQQYNGVYHVLGGIISPLEGIGPRDLTIDSLENRLKTDPIEEIILAINTTMEGETTCFYLFKRLVPYNVKITIIARGVAFGDELEYTDEHTLGRSIINRTPYSNS